MVGGQESSDFKKDICDKEVRETVVKEEQKGSRYRGKRAGQGGNKGTVEGGGGD